MKPVCVPCQRFMRMKESGFCFVEGMPANGVRGNPQPGLREPDGWQPYKLWLGDRYACPDCNAEVVTGFGRAPIAEHYQDGFAAKVTQFGADLLVKDC